MPIGERICPLINNVPMTEPECARYRLTRLFEIFQLKDGTQIFGGAIEKFVSWDIERRLDQGEVPADIDEILKTAGIDISVRVRSSGLGELDPLKDDLNESRRLTRKNLREFRDYFRPAFVRSVLELERETHGEPATGADRPAGEKLGRLCTLWLATSARGAQGEPDWPDDRVARICRAASLYSIHERPDAAGAVRPTLSVAELERGLDGRRFSERVCAYYRYKRANQLREVLQRPRPPRGGGESFTLGRPFEGWEGWGDEIELLEALTLPAARR